MGVNLLVEFTSRSLLETELFKTQKPGFINIINSSSWKQFKIRCRITKETYPTMHMYKH